MREIGICEWNNFESGRVEENSQGFSNFETLSGGTNHNNQLKRKVQPFMQNTYETKYHVVRNKFAHHFLVITFLFSSFLNFRKFLTDISD